MWSTLENLLGLNAESLNVSQMAVRAVVLYAAALFLVRLGDKRFLGKNTAFDVILGIILGSVISRAINGQAALFPTMAAGLVLVGLHWVLAGIAFRSDGFGTLVKGCPRLLVEDGEIRWDEMRRASLTRGDLEGALRSQAHLEALEQVRRAYLERSGNISVIRARREPRVLEVSVADGVQTVRIQLE
jgi:uncharacterized membrane protein YcaP (DUF421 family)